MPQVRLSLPSDYDRIRIVSTFEELVSTPFANGVNGICWRRTLSGDFAEIVQKLEADEGVTAVDDARLEALSLTASGECARDELRADLHRLRSRGLAPVLECVLGYPRDDALEIVPTDVYSFHVDSATVPTDTYLCSYTESASEGLRNDEAERRVDQAEVRARLLARFGGRDGPEFVRYLGEHCYDLHYAPLPAARPFSFGLGNLWRVAVAHPSCPVPPFVHRAPATEQGRPARLLLIS